jgi:1-phosphofructokinase family hexose kinase
MTAKICLTVTVNPAVDLFAEVPGFRPGADHRASRAVRYAGGKGVNVARALKAFRVPVCASGFLGGAAGDWMLRTLEKEKIPSAFIPVSGETRTNLTVLDPRAGRVTRVLEDGPRVSGREAAALRRFLRHEGAAYRYVVFSGSLPPGPGPEFYRELVGAGRRRGRKVFLDASGPALRQGLRAAPYGIKPNREEAEYIIGGNVRSRRQVREAVRALHRKGVQVVLLSLGPDGLVGSDGLSCWHAAVPAITGPAAVGCGDAALAGYLYAEIRRRPFPERVAFAAAAGTANALSPCPGCLTRADFNRTRQQVRLVQL